MRARSPASATAKVSSGVHSPRRRRTRVPCIWSSPISAGRNSLVLRALNKLPIATVTVREGARSLDTALDEMAQVFRFVSLDAELALRMREELASLVDRRSPMTLLVTHNLDEAIGLADRLLFLSPSPARILAEIPVVSPRGTQVPEQTAALRAEITRRLKP